MARTRASIRERIRFIANPTYGMGNPRRYQRTSANVRRDNREREQWNNLTMRQRIVGNAQQERYMRSVRRSAVRQALIGDVNGARRIVRANRHYFSNDVGSAMRIQRETLRRQMAVGAQPSGGMITNS